ncbi:uncharacterized protein PV09_02621 [Verruconis gallopava]|uniref:Protein kinase domain-containing protein n=1 Tax=Verruconis gallopava TaxID=253628 RepID=A0A0D1Z208_9PEZI|nr:uncharacterized protein PV09_02621 [Verruconis gallopava]KIW06962.1 hypothetical protein PV09_02621 [Verruconis gallopava]
MWSSALKSFQSNINANYKIADTPASTAGPWRIFEAKNRSTGKAVSVFVFDRKTLEPHTGGLASSRGSSSSIKSAQDAVVERLKREASSLARLRHPSILELVEPVEDTRSGGLQFATEPVTASLASLLKEKDEQEKSGGVGGRRSRYVVDDPESGGKKRRDIEIDELEIQKGLLQVGKGLEFLHESAGLVHCNLTPDAILINAKGDWKIAGLGFSGKSEGSTVATSAPPVAVSEILYFDARLPRFVQLNLDYSSPDLVMDSKASAPADMFSLGLLIVALYNSPHQSPLETNMSISAYKRLFASSSTTPTQANNFLSSTPLPRPVLNLLPRLITRKPAARMTAREFQEAEYFDNILVSTIRFLESLPAKTPNEKSQFLRGLPRIISQFPKTVLEKKVLPVLLEEMKDRELIALILQNVFKMIKLMPSSKRAVNEKVVPKLREVFLPSGGGGHKKDAATQERDSSKEAGLMVLLENVALIAENTNGKVFKDDIWPIIQLAMESQTHSLVDASLGTLPVILSTLDFSTVKNDVFPVIATVFSKTSSLGIKIRGLEALQILCGGTPGGETDGGDGLDGFDPQEQSKKKQQSVILDKYTIQEKVVPLLKAIKTKEPAVMMAALDVFKEIGKIADSDFLAMDVLPILWNMSLGPLLNLQQFQAFMALIKSLSSRIESEHTRKLQELSATNATTANRADFMSSLAPTNRTNGLDDASGDNHDFENLVLGRDKQSRANSNVFDSSLDSWSQPSPSVPRPSGSRTTSPAVTFSWSTPPQPQTMSTLKPAQNSVSRTVTPDQSLSAFTTLQPSTPSSTNTIGASSFSTTPLQTIQPMQPILPLRPTSQATTASSRTIDWSSAANMSSASVWGSNSATATTPNYTTSSGINAWGSQASTSSLSQQQTSSFAIPPPPKSPYSNFSIAPPPAQQQQTTTSNTFGGMGNMQSQNQMGQKHGIDKYESLL